MRPFVRLIQMATYLHYATFAVIYNLSRIYGYMHGPFAQMTDGRARIPRVYIPFEFARNTRRIKYQNSISSGIAILRDSPTVPISLPFFSLHPRHPLSHLSLWLPSYIGERTACIISTWMREKEMVDVRGAGGDICGVSPWENNRLLRAWRASSVGKFTQNVVADRAGGDATVDHCVACAAPTFLTTMTGTSDPIRTSPARSAWAIAS